MKAILWLFVFAFFLAPLAALAQAAAVLPADPGGLLQFVIDAYKAKHWQPLVAALISLLVYAYAWLSAKTSFFAKLPAKFVPWMAMIVGILGSLATSLADTTTPWYAAVLHGVATGAAATGLWEALFQHLLPQPPPTPIKS